MNLAKALDLGRSVIGAVPPTSLAVKRRGILTPYRRPILTASLSARWIDADAAERRMDRWRRTNVRVFWAQARFFEAPAVVAGLDDVTVMGEPIYDERFCRMWEFYLAGCEAAFRHAGLVVFQIQLCERLDTVPLMRDYIAEWERSQNPT